MTLCSELEPGDHRVLGQLTSLAKGFQRLCNPAKTTLAYRRLSMDEAEWKDRVLSLIDNGFVVRENGKLYVEIKCLCRRIDGMPRIGAKSRDPLREEESEPGWKRVSTARKSSAHRSASSSVPARHGRRPPVGGSIEVVPSIDRSNELVDARLAPGAKALRKVQHAASTSMERSAKSPVTTLRGLRMAFKAKFVEAQIVDVLKMPVTRILDDESEGAFTAALKRMRQEQGLSPDQIMAMMDEFMKLVLAKAIPIRGKTVWKVFVARRQDLFEHADRTRKLGSSEGKMLSDEVQERRTSERLDRPLRRD